MARATKKKSGPVSKAEPKIPRRENARMTKAQAKSMALEAVANALEGTFASSAVEGFTVRVLREKKRAPTEGERNLFLGEVAKIVEGLRGRVKG